MPEFDFDEEHTFLLRRLPVHPQATMREELIGAQPPTQSPTQSSDPVRRLLTVLSKGVICLVNQPPFPCDILCK